ncbi:indole-diterpene biosynthesis protein-like protein PaxU [Byssothecium circinans]|uniref:Indole-diterpene biosynthesis protein-like protein PaxU n=1 Tax=Byssothecium circinans TaxID=147558 RepID=A0A6A5THN9_9PLEO|nr:indole-diterpene biosynthesis protein-like protein PaxU [Byssothecium circinans]
MLETQSGSASPKFNHLGASTYLHTPSNAFEGQLIILATWMGAANKHIAKYTTLYSKIAPHVRILLVKGSIDGMLYSYARQRKAIKPAVNVVRQVLNECEYTKQGAHGKRKPQILLHVFSNGGANTTTNLVHVLRQELGHPLPLIGLIIDSALAKGGYQQNYPGFIRSLPSNLVTKILGPPLVNLAIFILEASIAMGRFERPEDLWRSTILNEEMMRVGDPGEEGSRRICYFASKADENTRWEDTISHAELAKQRGWDVKVFLWDDTSHCNHISKHKEEYSGAVEAMWMKAKL